ncbi:DUF6249 domain-containing protein [Hellea balneolensis]|uniref:DUF6249 domain-containing protein n=1 Tax=Hellea balneolensis TaxID=287478 RepID=UPI0004009515|nr:DUF6249 domain-containing protein [Hellea balneolensis]
MSDEIVGVVLFASIPAAIWAVSAYRHKTQKAATEVMKAMVDKGEALTPETIRALGIRPKRKHGDLRTGLILIALAIATIILGSAIPEKEAQQVFGGFAMFPLLVGLAYIGLWTFISRKNPED